MALKYIWPYAYLISVPSFFSHSLLSSYSSIQSNIFILSIKICCTAVIGWKGPSQSGTSWAGAAYCVKCDSTHSNSPASDLSLTLKATVFPMASWFPGNRPYVQVRIFWTFYLFMLCVFPIMHLSPTHVPLSLQPLPRQNKMKFKRKKERKNQSRHESCCVTQWGT